MVPSRRAFKIVAVHLSVRQTKEWLSGRVFVKTAQIFTHIYRTLLANSIQTVGASFGAEENY